MGTTRDELQAVFHDVFDDDTIVLRDEMTANDIDGWDSLMHINLIIAVEKHFGVKFSIAEISILKGAGQNVGTFLAAIQKKVAARS